MRGKLCGESLPKLVAALLFSVVVWCINRQYAEWCFDGVDGDLEEAAINACEICDGWCEVWCSDE